MNTEIVPVMYQLIYEWITTYLCTGNLATILTDTSIILLFIVAVLFIVSLFRLVSRCVK